MTSKHSFKLSSYLVERFLNLGTPLICLFLRNGVCCFSLPAWCPSKSVILSHSKFFLFILNNRIVKYPFKCWLDSGHFANSQCYTSLFTVRVLTQW